MPANVNEKLTEAARRGAAGHTGVAASAFAALPTAVQEALLSHITTNRTMTLEVIRTAVNAMPLEELEDMLNEIGETTDPAGKAAQQHLHTGKDA